MNEIEQFMSDLRQTNQLEFFTEPISVSDLVYKMETKKDFIFDDVFWEIFQRHPFKICHIAKSEMGIPTEQYNLYFGIIRGSDSKETLQ